MDSTTTDFTTPASTHTSLQEGEPEREWADGACKSCGAETTKAAFSRHKLNSCPSRVRKRRYGCRGCPASFSRPDALKRHWKKTGCPGRHSRWAATPPASNSSSVSGGDLHANLPAMTQVPQGSNSLESSPTPILLAPMAVAFTSVASASHGHILPQLSPTHYTTNKPYANLSLLPNPSLFANHNSHVNRHPAPVAFTSVASASYSHILPQIPPTPYVTNNVNPGPSHNPNLFTDHNSYVNRHPTPQVIGGYDQHGLTPQFSPQHLPLLFNSNHPSLVAHQENYLRSQPLGSALQFFQSVPPLQYGHRANPMASMSGPGGERLWSSNGFALGALRRDQFPFNISLTHEGPSVFTNNYMQHRVPYNSFAYQPTPHGMPSLAITQLNRSQSEADEGLIESAHDMIRSQPAPEPPQTLSGEGSTNNQAMTAPNTLDPPHALQFASGSSELEPTLNHDPSLELGHGSPLEAQISASAGFTTTDSWTMLFPSPEHSSLEGIVSLPFQS